MGKLSELEYRELKYLVVFGSTATIRIRTGKNQFQQIY